MEKVDIKKAILELSKKSYRYHNLWCQLTSMTEEQREMFLSNIQSRNPSTVSELITYLGY